MRQISAQKETRLLIAKKFGSKPPSDARQQTGDGKEVTSEPQYDLKARLARGDVETVASVQHDAKISDRAAEHAEHVVEHRGDSAKNRDLRAATNKDMNAFLGELKNALLSSFIVTYAQGMSLLQTASVEKQYGLNVAEIAKIWRGGCIIRSALLEDMRRAFSEVPELPNLMLDSNFAEILNENRMDWRDTVERFTASRIPALCLSSALSYFDAFRSERLPANLIQAQRDFFGAHTYQRIDKEGIFHTPDWNDQGVRPRN
jgi:6-phosphogluconate dehydrogenase